MQASSSIHVLYPIIVTSCLSVVSAWPIGAQEAPQDILVDAKLVAEEGVDGDNFGAALAVEGDVMAVAAPGADLDGQDEVDSSGVVYVFLRDQDTGQWIQHQTLVPTRGHYEGNFLDMTLAIQANTLVVGAPYATLDRFQEGAVYVFERDETGNWTQSARITDVSVGYNGHFGKSVALEGDLLVVGATEEYFDVHGRVGIFERDRGGTDNWGRVTTLYGYNWRDPSTSVNDAGNPSSFGSSVMLQDDLLLVGASRTSVAPGTVDGAAYIFRRSATDPDRWDFVSRLVRPGADDCVGGLPLSQFYLEATGEEREEAAACAQANPVKAGGFGNQVAMDGDTLVVAAQSARGGDGSYSVGEVYVYQRDPGAGDVWPHTATLSASDPSSFAYFGSDLALAGDTLVVAARGTTVDSRQYQGAVYVFERALASGRWDQVEKLIASDGLSLAFFGEAVALDGHTSLIGANGDHANRGAVYLHEATPPEEPGDPCVPSFGTTAELTGVSVATDSSGVILGAVAGTVSGTLPVWIHEVAPPSEPLFDSAVPLGAYYNVGAGCTTPAPQDAPFVVALPVPPGTDPSNLGAAVLVAAEDLNDGPQSGNFWLPVSGAYDASHQLYMFALGALEEGGHTLVLIQHPDLGPVQPTAMRTRSSALAAPQFLVQCFGLTSGCGVAEEALVQQKLLDSYVKFNAYDFPAPALDNTRLRWNPTTLFSVETTSLLYRQIYIRSSADPVCDSAGHGSAGVYNFAAGAGTISFCMDPGAGFPDEDSLTRTATHELFHATQWAFDKVREGPQDDWVMEGTADAAVYSDDEMHRRVERNLRNVSVPLTHERGESAPELFYPYQTQDFWIHLLQWDHRNFELGELASFLERGASTTSVADRLANPPSVIYGTLGQEYWAWAKNQIVEKEITFDDALQDPCRLEATLVDTIDFEYPAVDHIFDSLGPLQTELIRISLHDEEHPADGFDNVRVVAEGDQLKYKVYRVVDPGADPSIVEPNCVEIPDGGENGRSFAHLPADSLVYVLMSRTRHEEEVVEPPLYRVWIDRETIPEQQETLLEAQ